MSGAVHRGFSCLARWTDRLERTLLTVLTTGMVLLAAAQVLLRNLWHSGWPWAEPLLGMALLWMTMLGALAAIGQGRHIAIDLATALFPKPLAAVCARATGLAAAVICGILSFAAVRYVGFLSEMDVGQLLGVPLWKFYEVIPVVFALMAFRFTVRAFLPTSWQTVSRPTDFKAES